MKKNYKKVLALVSVFALVLCCNVPAFAAELPDAEITEMTIENTISPMSASYASSGVNISSSKWTTVASSTTGINGNVRIMVSNVNLFATNTVRMLGKNGNVVWSEEKAIGYNGDRVFWCGSDVYTVQVKTSSGVGTAVCVPK